jgi:hypothetical protein
MKQRVSAVVRRSSAAPAAGSFGNKDLHTDTAVVHAPSLGAGGPGRVWGWPDGSKRSGVPACPSRAQGIPGCELDAWMSD